MIFGKIIIKINVFENNSLDTAILHHNLSSFIKIVTSFCDMFLSLYILLLPVALSI